MKRKSVQLMLTPLGDKKRNTNKPKNDEFRMNLLKSG